MPLAYFVLGLPRSATTRIYKDICERARRLIGALCVFEPTNWEVMENVVKGVKHVHDVVGEVPYDYEKLPRDLVEWIHGNTRWHREWMERERPSEPFLGRDFFKIMDELDRRPEPVVVKDVHAWVRLPELAARYPRTVFVVTLPTWETWIESMKKRLRVVPNPLDKAGIGKFYRLFTGGHYYRSTTVDALVKEAEYVYERYVQIVNTCAGWARVVPVVFHGRLPDEASRLLAEVLV